MDPFDAGGGPGLERFGPMIEHGDTVWGGAIQVLPLILLLVAIGVAIWAVLRFTSRPAAVVGAPAGPRPAAVVGAPAGPRPAPLRPDPAVDEVRIRYARGEVTREEFLTRAGDLGADLTAGAREAPEAPEAPPATPEANRPNE